MQLRLGIGIIAVLAALLCVFVAVQPPAGESGEAGDGKSSPLRLVSSSPADGQTDVPLQVEIKLSFSKNVVNMRVKDGNMRCFALYSADSSRVPADVRMADDQIEFEKRRDVILVPVQKLQPGTAYTVKVSPELQAKSGAKMGEPAAITFVTAAGAGPSGGKAERRTAAPVAAPGMDPLTGEYPEASGAGSAEAGRGKDSDGAETGAAPEGATGLSLGTASIPAGDENGPSLEEAGSAAAPQADAAAEKVEEQKPEQGISYGTAMAAVLVMVLALTAIGCTLIKKRGR